MCNVWIKYGFEKAMMTTSSIYYFKFSSEQGVLKVLEEGPWMIRNIPIILNRWFPDVNVTKAEVTNVLYGLNFMMCLLLDLRMTV